MGGGIAACAAAQEPRIFQAEYETYVSKQPVAAAVSAVFRHEDMVSPAKKIIETAAQEPRIFQAEYETYVSKKEQERFVKKLCRRKNIDAKLIRVIFVFLQYDFADRFYLQLFYQRKIRNAM